MNIGITVHAPGRTGNGVTGAFKHEGPVKNEKTSLNSNSSEQANSTEIWSPLGAARNIEGRSGGKSKYI